MSSDEQLRVTERQVAERVEAGDVLDEPRPVDHLFFFADRRAAKGAAAALAPRGGRVKVRRSSGAYSLTLTVVAPVDLESALATTCGMLAVAAELGGEYDGWGGPIVEPADS